MPLDLLLQEGPGVGGHKSSPEASAVVGRVGVKAEGLLAVGWSTRSRGPHQTGCLVKYTKSRSLEEEMNLFCLPIKESEIIDHFLGGEGFPQEQGFEVNASAQADPHWPVDQVQGICHHYRLQLVCWSGIKCSREVATVFCGAIILAKISMVPVQRGYWKADWQAPHHPLLGDQPRHHGPHPAPGPLASPQPSPSDRCTQAWGCTATLGSHTKATFDAISRICSSFIADLWKETMFTKFHIRNSWNSLLRPTRECLCRRPRAPTGHHTVFIQEKLK